MTESLKFLRADLAKLAAYKPHPGGASTQPLDLLDTNESPLDLPQELKVKLGNFYQHSLEANRYPDGGHTQLKSAIAEYVQESAELTDQITPNHISVGNGSDELIRSLLIATCLGGNGSILVAQPTFSMYAILAQTLGIPVQTIERQAHNFAIDVEQAQVAISNRSKETTPVRVVFVVHPNSPTGNCLTSAEIEWLKSLPKDILVVVDEAYFEFSKLSLVAEISQRPNWIILRTFSKAFRLAAHRVGYAIADPEVIQALEKVRLPYNLPAFSQNAALLALQNRQVLLPLVTETICQRDLMWQELSNEFASDLQLWRSQANFLYIRLAKAKDQDLELASLVTKLKNCGTLIRHTDEGIRITVGTEAENQRTINNLRACLLSIS